MMVVSTVRFTGSLLLWAGYQALLVSSSTRYASAEPNSITLDNNKITIFQEPKSESNPSGMEYYSRLHHPSSEQTVIQHSKTFASHQSSKLRVSELQLKLLLALVPIKTLEEHEKQPDTLKKITELDPKMKWKQYSHKHKVHRNEFKILDAHEKSQKCDAYETSADKSRTSDIRDRYHKETSESSKQTSGQTVTKSSKEKDINYVYRNISSVVDFIYNHVFGSSEKNKQDKVSPLDGKICDNLAEDEHFLNHDSTEAGHHGERYRRNSPLTTIHKVNAEDSIEKQSDFVWKDEISQDNREEDFKVYKKGIKLYGTGYLEDQNLKDGENKGTLKDLLLDFELTGEEESLSTLIKKMDHNMKSEDFTSNYSRNYASLRSDRIAENVGVKRNIVKSVQSSGSEKNSSINNLQPSKTEESNLTYEKEHQRNSGWMGYIIIGGSVVAFLILISVLVVYGIKLCKWQKSHKPRMLEILQPSAAI